MTNFFLGGKIQTQLQYFFLIYSITCQMAFSRSLDTLKNSTLPIGAQNHSLFHNPYSQLIDNPNCPPPFNCLVDKDACYNFANCSEYTRYCDCPPGFGDPDCSKPQCGSLVKGKDRPLRPPGQNQCTCDDGWTGVNCNVCIQDNVCDAVTYDGTSGKCINSLVPLVSRNHFMCDVTNKRIVQELGQRRPEIGLTCDKLSATCDFQFWAGGQQSFYCHLNDCDFKKATKDHSDITCNHVTCKCYPGHILCGEGGTIDLSGWFADPDERPRGPASFRCSEKDSNGSISRDCIFTEDHVNELIRTFFDDDSITLACNFGGECMHSSQAPGHGGERPPEVGGEFSFLAMILMLLGVLGLIAILISLIWFLFYKNGRGNVDGFGADSATRNDTVPESETLLLHHLSCTLMFRDLSYVLDSTRTIHAGVTTDSSSSGQSGAQSSNNENAHDAQVEVDIHEDGTNVTESIGLSLSNSNSREDVRAPLLGNPESRTASNKKSKMVVIEGVSGIVRPGQVMAIMGGSGAGKTTLLDLLARKNKSGTVYGDILVNGSFMDYQEYKSIIGYVDQEDTLMDTLTVYETILYSALLRLPKKMSLQEKKKRVQETMIELDILHIANRRIGSSNKRGLSGGEKRRVSIACELVTSPSVLFLDEPTSGLDTYSAYNVIEALVSLARNFQRTIILTIHQPRSNIYALFDQLVLLAKGRVVYSGPAQEKVLDHFASIGFECPLGFNIADYLVDLTMHAANEIPDDASEQQDPPTVTESLLGLISPSPDSTDGPLSPRRRSAIRTLQEDRLYNRQKNRSSRSVQRRNSLFGRTVASSSIAANPTSPTAATGTNQSAFLDTVFPGTTLIRPEITEQLSDLIDAFANSEIIQGLNYEINTALSGSYPSENGLAGSEILDRARLRARTSSMVAIGNRGFFWQAKDFIYSLIDNNSRNQSKPQRERASWWTQFMILSGRTFRNLYRNPNLLLTHYATSIVISVIVGILFWQVDLTLAGFQNRMGVMSFICAVFGFSCVTSLQVFASERLIFVRERANRYYSPITYFLSKILFDMLPLRIIPPILFGIICYFMIGLRPDLMIMLRFLLVLVMFNLTSAAACLAISIIITDPGIANLVATMVMLFEMLFGGLLLNKKSIPESLSWLPNLSFFNFAFEGLVANEMRGLTLVQNKFGINIEVPANIILDTFGLDAFGYWRDVQALAIMSAVFLGVGFLWLQFFVKERR